MIKVSINLSKIDENQGRIFTSKKGERWVSIVLKDKPDQFGNDGFIALDVSKEERERKVSGAIVGNWKNIGGAPRPPQPRQQPNPEGAW